MTRVLLKMSGEAIADPEGEGVVDARRLQSFAEQVRRAKEQDPQLAIAVVVGGGNILRGKALAGVRRTRADHMGMLATIINALALQDAFEQLGVESRVMSGIEVPKIAEPHVHGRALKHLSRGRVVIFAGGTGDTHFTTDTAAALRACEIEASVLLLAKYGTQGVYDHDPNLSAEALLFESVTYEDVQALNLQVMDLTGVQLCKEEAIPIYVFDMQENDAVLLALRGDRSRGSTICDQSPSTFRQL